MSRKPRADAKLKNLPDALQENLWQFLRRNSGDKTAAWLETQHGITTSAAALSDFFSWYPRQATLRRAADTSSQLEQTLRKMPQLKVTAEQARQVAQVNFEIQAAADRDPALFAALRRGELETARLALEREKFEHDKKADWEKGLDALHDEIKACPAALKHFEALKAALKEAHK